MKRSSARGQWSGVVCGLGKREGLVRGMERKAVRGRAHDTQTLTAFKYAHAHGACVSEQRVWKFVGNQRLRKGGENAVRASRRRKAAKGA